MRLPEESRTLQVTFEQGHAHLLNIKSGYCPAHCLCYLSLLCPIKFKCVLSTVCRLLYTATQTLHMFLSSSVCEAVNCRRLQMGDATNASP